SSFRGSVISHDRVRLDWSTLSEIRNYGFEVQKRRDTLTSFATIPNSIIPGHGTTIEPHSYSFTDSTATLGRWSYRLRIRDSSNELTYSEPIWVNVVTSVADSRTPSKFYLEQNFPNPFNPSTTIRYTLPKETHVVLKVFNDLGKEIATLVNAVEQEGQHEVRFDTNILASGSYYCRLEADGFSETKQLMLLK
ncbi:MAG: T9SS type A sorting domain-containing protein, partial [Bacteroidota bacterium]